MGRVIHFEIQATQPQELVDFYTALLGWKFSKWDGPNEYWLIETGPAERPGIDGGLLPRRGPNSTAIGQPVNCFVCTIETPSLDEHLDQGAMLGGTVVVPKMPVPGVGWLAYLKDPDGNIFGLMQPDSNAC